MDKDFSISFRFKDGQLSRVEEIAYTGVQHDPEYPLRLNKQDKIEVYKTIRRECKSITEKEDELTKFLKMAKDTLDEDQLRELGSMLNPKD